MRPKTYRTSALASALVRMWRGWAVIVPVVVLNALVQALLVWPQVGVDDWLPFVALALASFVAFALAYGLVGTTALRVADGRVSWHEGSAGLRASRARYAIWVVAYTLVLLIGFALYAIPGYVVLAVSPFLLLAALDGRRSPLETNFRVIGRRFWRWLVTMVVTGLVVAIGWLLAGVTNFFVRGVAASFAVWLVAGFVLAWFTTAWALIYRSAAADDRG